MTFWILLSGAIVLAFVVIGYGLDAWAERRPTGVSPSDWDRVSAERQREHLNRVMGKR
jgi:hypothetical protein